MQTKLLSHADLAATAGLSRDQLEYILRTRDIEPAARVGKYRLFDEQALEAVQAVIAERRHRGQQRRRRRGGLSKGGGRG